MTPARETGERLGEVCTIIGNQIRLIQTMVSYIIMCDLVLLHEEKKGDINPPSRVRNSRLGESQGWPLDHSLFFSLSPFISLSPAISNNPGKFNDIQSLPRVFHK